MSWCTSGVGLQVLLFFIDNSHLGSIFASSDFLVYYASYLLMYI